MNQGWIKWIVFLIPEIVSANMICQSYDEKSYIVWNKKDINTTASQYKALKYK